MADPAKPTAAKPNRTQRPTSFWLSPEDNRILDAIAAAQGQRRTAVVRWALRTLAKAVCPDALRPEATHATPETPEAPETSRPASQVSRTAGQPGKSDRAEKT